jgi:hypothetical protein
MHNDATNRVGESVGIREYAGDVGLYAGLVELQPPDT